MLIKPTTSVTAGEQASHYILPAARWEITEGLAARAVDGIGKGLAKAPPEVMFGK